MINGRIQTGDKLALISLKMAKEIFGENEPWVDDVERILGWGSLVQVGEETEDEDSMFAIDKCPYAFKAVCFTTASDAKLEKLQALYKENKPSENASSEE